MNNREERMFGTDGIRGTPGIYPLSDGMVFKIGSSVAKLLFRKNKKDFSPTVIIGRDTRESGKHLEVVLANALSSHGVDVFLAGTIPTPGLSYLVKYLKASMGIMISASHNKPGDNGIKFFSEDGSKLSVEQEAWMEQLILSSLIHSSNGGQYRKKGKVDIYSQAAADCVEFLMSTAADLSLEGFKVVFDCAWGASSSIAPELFKELGINAVAIHDLPEGKNINQGGAMNPEILRQRVLTEKADVGFAFDGDGDQVILVDEQGTVLDGDYIMAIIGTYLLAKGRLAKNTLVNTTMSNYGLKQAIENAGGRVITAEVGDKHVVEALTGNNLNFGGEQSGHIIISDYASSPDGLLIALMILRIMKETNKPLSELASVMDKFPQVLVSVKVRTKKPLATMPEIYQAIEDSKRKLRDFGRLIVRYSGTENSVRIMVEGKDSGFIQEIALSLRALFEKEIGAEQLEPHAQN